MNTFSKVSVTAGVALVLSLLAAQALIAEEQTTYSTLQKTASYDASSVFMEGEENMNVFDFAFDNSKRIVIIDQYGNKIREERLASDLSLCNSTLVPMIYKCSFVTETYGVCYYLLRKN